MRKSVKITCCGIISAIAAVILLATNIPIMLYAIPALAGIVYIVPAIEFGTKWAFLCYGITAIISLVLPCEREALIVFIGILGYYPIVKMLIERLNNRLLEYILKLLLFNVSIIASYTVVIKLMGITVLENDMFGLKITVALLLLAGNIVFLVFDFTLTRILQLYFIKLRKIVRKTLGIKGKN